MAKKVTITLTDDIDESPAAETVSFALDGVSYEIDLSEANSAKLRDALALYIAHGQKVGGRKVAGRPSSGGKRANTAAIREWARGEGHSVNERGRIPAHIVAAYEKANS
jgi:hypothetical protein